MGENEVGPNINMENTHIISLSEESHARLKTLADLDSQELPQYVHDALNHYAVPTMNEDRIYYDVLPFVDANTKILPEMGEEYTWIIDTLDEANLMATTLGGDYRATEVTLASAFEYAVDYDINHICLVGNRGGEWVILRAWRLGD